MKFLSLAITALTITANGSIAATRNYCDTNLCAGAHIACGNNWDFSSNCRNPQEVHITQELKEIILNSHNEKRNYVAGGGYDALQPACRMATMQWDDELASLATLNVKKCQMKHDCHDTDAFKYSGQNIAWITYHGSADSLRLTRQSIDMWYNEIHDTHMSHIQSFPSSYKGPAIGHFTVMMAAKNIRLGCAASTYSMGRGSYRAFLFTCNYATTNMIEFPIYKDCKQAATECTTGRNPNYSNLCSVSERYNVNSWWF